MNGDVLTDGDVSALIAFHSASKALATIYLSPVEDPSRFGVVPTDEDGRVIAFVEKPPPGEAPTNLINAGIYVMEPAVLDRIPRDVEYSVERETFPHSHRRIAVRDERRCLLDDTGTPEAYIQAQRDLLTGRRGDPPSPGATRSTGGAWVVGSADLSGEVDSFSLLGAQALRYNTERS